MAEDKLTVLLVEDDEVQHEMYKEYAAQVDDIRLAAITNSSDKGLELTQAHLPDVVVLDLELNAGSGSGIEYLLGLNEMSIEKRPLVFIITNTKSEVLYDYARKSGADFVFYKQKPDYSAKKVLEFGKMLSQSTPAAARVQKTLEAPEVQKQKLYDRVHRELELVGISPKLTGSQYLVEAIQMLLMSDDKTFARAVYQELSKKYKKTENAITRAMQTAINSAWRKTAIEDLEVYYTAKVDHQSGVPTVTEFIYFYVNKLEKAV